MDSTCPLCGHTQPTIHHILSSCPEALQQGRYTWRHDSALQTLVKSIKEHLDCNTTLYADLPGMRASENPVATIPDDTLVSSARPDIVLVGEDEVTLIELTINFLTTLWRVCPMLEIASHKKIFICTLSVTWKQKVLSQTFTPLRLGHSVIGYQLPRELY